jgi:preprotein translocase subunit SecF
MEFFHKVTSFRFMAMRKYCYAFSAVLMVASAIALWKPGLSYGIDYTGGIAIELNFPAAPDLDAVRQALGGAGFADAQIQNYGTPRDVVVRLGPRDKMTGQVIGDAVLNAVRQVSPEVQLSRVDVVGPQVGAELREKGYLAMLVTFIGILGYIWMRFELKLSIGALLAGLHTPLVILGFFAATGTTFDLTVLAGILAVVGYQINDTVVVFDRVREKFPVMRNSTPAEVLDASINQTLSRTVNTHLATSIVVTALLLLGGPTLHGFATAILIGILVGTYSSIYIASASALDLKLSAKDLMTVRKERAPVDNMP